MSTATKAPQTRSPQIEVKREPVSGAEIVVQSLVNHGVEVVFAYPGGASMPIHQALTRDIGIKFALCFRDMSRAAVSPLRGMPGLQVKLACS